MPGEVVLGGGIVEDGSSSRASGNLSSGGARGLLPWRRGVAPGLAADGPSSAFREGLGRALGPPYRAPGSGGHKQQELTFSHFWRLEAQGLLSFEASLVGFEVAVSLLCLLRVAPLNVSVLITSYEDPSHFGLRPTLRASL